MKYWKVCLLLPLCIGALLITDLRAYAQSPGTSAILNSPASGASIFYYAPDTSATITIDASSVEAWVWDFVDTQVQVHYQMWTKIDSSVRLDSDEDTVTANLVFGFWSHLAHGTGNMGGALSRQDPPTDHYAEAFSRCDVGTSTQQTTDTHWFTVHNGD
jgi:hypothetical protein